MTKDFELKIKNPLLGDEEDDGSSGSSGQAIEFHIDDPWLDRPLSAEELQMLEEHEQRQATHVKDAQEKKREREQAKEARGEYQQGRAHTEGFMNESSQDFKKHPLSDMPQFQGMDNEVSPMPSEADTEEMNPEMQNRLEKNLEKRHDHQPKMAHYNTPRPNPMGGG